MTTAPQLSIIVPAYNEERFITRMIRAARAHTAWLKTEIIVVDNGSRDRTRELARDAGADLVLQATGTVAAVRNAGARRAGAPVFVFLDADVLLTPEWERAMRHVLPEVQQRRLLTGSWVSVPESPTWIERHWFKPLEHGSNSHINSGHLIISRHLFEEIGGFDARLPTGEDVDISSRAADAGAQVVDDVRLKVIHEGYPKTLGEFVRREIWHGTGDCQTLRGFAGSRVAVLGALLLHAQVVALIASIVFKNAAWIVASFSGALLVCLLASIYRYRSVPLTTRIVTTMLYFAYFMARGLSLYRRRKRAVTVIPSVHGGRH